tara:strand:- start:2445 stop:2744 length:300 start_codon:yes stop_codon:yes gene_type:complete
MNDQSEKMIAAKVGEIFEICLWEDRTRGELWVSTYNSDQISLIDDDFQRKTSGTINDSGMRIFRFRAEQSGRYGLVFEKRLGWRFTSIKRRDYVVSIKT